MQDFKVFRIIYRDNGPNSKLSNRILIMNESGRDLIIQREKERIESCLLKNKDPKAGYFEEDLQELSWKGLANNEPLTLNSLINLKYLIDCQVHQTVVSTEGEVHTLRQEVNQLTENVVKLTQVIEQMLNNSGPKPNHH